MQKHFISVQRGTSLVEAGFIDSNGEYNNVVINIIDNEKNYGVAMMTPDGGSYCMLVKDDKLSMTFDAAGIEFEFNMSSDPHFTNIEFHSVD